MRNPYRDILFGLAVGDALGVPVEFESRERIQQNPVTDMRGFGTHYVPAGTFSDDSSLAFCLAEALTHPFRVATIAATFSAWLNTGYWTPHGSVFDVGIATSQAIRRIDQGTPPELAGGSDEHDNGNGALMRILPLLVYIQHKPIGERYRITRQVASITHRHIRSVIACFYYLELARQLLTGSDKFSAYQTVQSLVKNFLSEQTIDPAEITVFDRLLNDTIYEEPAEKIFSSGYVVHTLEASIWCLLTTDNYRDATLKAVNLGADTDTTGAVTGGLAGLLYGWETIPKPWLDQLARQTDIADLAQRLENATYATFNT